MGPLLPLMALGAFLLYANQVRSVNEVEIAKTSPYEVEIGWAYTDGDYMFKIELISKGDGQQIESMEISNKSIKFDSLSPDTEYLFKITALRRESGDTWKSGSQTEFTFRTLSDYWPATTKPSPNVTQPRTNELNNIMYTSTWTTPEFEGLNEIMFEVCKVLEGTDPNCVNTSVSSQKTQIETPLEYFQNYTLQTFAVYRQPLNHEFVIPSEITRFRTIQGAPSAISSFNISVVNYKPHLTWGVPEELRGPLDGYRLRVTTDFMSISRTLDPALNSLYYNEALCDVYYELSISAFNFDAEKKPIFGEESFQTVQPIRCPDPADESLLYLCLLFLTIVFSLVFLAYYIISKGSTKSIRSRVFLDNTVSTFEKCSHSDVPIVKCV